MKKLIFILLLFSAPPVAFAQGFVVNNFIADFYLNEEGYFDVIENYEVEFLQPKHGLYREILTDYTIKNTDGKNEKRHLVIQHIEVPNHHFEISSKWEQRTDGKIEIKIGEKDKLVSGIQHYEIRYRVYNGFLFDGDLVQFYWNIKPNGWRAIFQQISFNIHTPEGAVLSPENCFVYAGNTGTTVVSTDFENTYSNGKFSGKSPRYYFSAPGQDVTVLVKLPQNLIRENIIKPPFWQQYGWMAALATLLVAFWLVWLKFGKDDKVTSVTTYYPPQGIDPAMAGYLINDRDDASDLMALIPHWASQGLIEIEEIPKSGIFGKSDMKLRKLNNIPISTPEYEQSMFNSLFNIWGNEVLVSSLNRSFYVVMNLCREHLKKTAQQYYESRAKKVMKITTRVAVALGVVLSPVFLFTVGVTAAFLAPVVCVFIAFMSFYLQKKNQHGNAVFSELKGFREFIKLTEVNQIKALIEQDPHYFEKTMSYALAFGLLDGWAKKFDSLNIPPPTWYHSSGSQLWKMQLFSKSFQVSMASAQSAMVRAPSGSRSGGGASGGGFGGGGGGSW